MHYQGSIIRPPSEANSILLQVTVGCSHNRCTFCGVYQEDRFCFKPLSQVEADIEYAARYYSNVRRLFLCDGDALILPQDHLLSILNLVREKLPKVTRVGTYANAKSLMRKSDDELLALREAGLGIAYVGLESGDDTVLKAVDKGVTAAQQIEQVQRLQRAGIKRSITVLLGIAGREGSLQHARLTGEALTQMDPEYVGALTVMLVPGTSLYNQWRSGEFALPDPIEILSELREMLSYTHLTGGQFMANHASNYLPLKLRLPRDHADGCAQLDAAIAGALPLRDEWMRNL
jgi:radical SAM superfamily enzyme YgiQ (UPF0313 family)